MRPFMSVNCNLLLLIVCLSATVGGQETESSSPSHADQRLQMSRMAKSYEIKVASDDSEKLKLVDDPIFSWANPLRRADAGVIHLWTLHGRPIATMGIWTTSETGSTNGYEFQSLAEDLLVARSDRLDSWTPKRPGAKFERVLDDQEPSVDPRRRLSQMKAIAEKHFAATLDPDTPNQETLRLLPSPLFRYAEKPKQVIDGAIFAFAQDTDPEAFLILEVRSAGNKFEWHYAMAPSTSHGIRATCDEKEVIRTQRILGNSADNQGTFMMRFFDDDFINSFK